jgi:uncharacterized protein
MKRAIMHKLVEWKGGPGRKPLILMGARQVGKTSILKQFGASHYQKTVYLNFEDNPKLCKLFEASLAPEAILKALMIEFDITIEPDQTLIIFDEIQECPSALNSLKYFCENAPEYHVAAAGSLLGVKLRHEKGFPVGKVQFLTLYPLSFLEFLQVNNQERLTQYIEELKKPEPLPPNLHDKLLESFKEYLFVGGMPEAVYEFLQTKNLSKVREIQDSILRAYSLDFAKHAPKDQVMKINQIWGSIPQQLAKENKKFLYSALRPGARAKEFEVALQWLIEAGLIHKVSQISCPKIPLSAYADFNIFKLYLVDVGLIGAMSKLAAKTILYDNDLFQEFRGALTENFVTEELVHSQFSLFYWTSEGRAEVDFVIEYDGSIYPLEVKSGPSSKKKSLLVYADQYSPKLLIRASPMNLKKDGDILNCPLYLLERLTHFL